MTRPGRAAPRMEALCSSQERTGRRRSTGHGHQVEHGPDKAGHLAGQGDAI
jgi:hypothetical protein